MAANPPRKRGMATAVEGHYPCGLAPRIRDVRRVCAEEVGRGDGVKLSRVILVDGELAGRVTIGGIRWGAKRGGSIGYWIAEPFAGKGYTTRAVRLIIQYGLEQGLHRLEIAVRPENEASLALVRKLISVKKGCGPTTSISMAIGVIIASLPALLTDTPRISAGLGPRARTRPFGGVSGGWGAYSQLTNGSNISVGGWGCRTVRLTAQGYDRRHGHIPLSVRATDLYFGIR